MKGGRQDEMWFTHDKIKVCKRTKTLEDQRTVGLLSKGFPAHSRVSWVIVVSIVDRFLIFEISLRNTESFLIQNFPQKLQMSIKMQPGCTVSLQFSVYCISIFPRCQKSNNMCILLAEDFWAQNTWNTAHRSCVGKTAQPFLCSVEYGETTVENFVQTQFDLFWSLNCGPSIKQFSSYVKNGLYLNCK